jgi:hypothetical protein
MRYLLPSQIGHYRRSGVPGDDADFRIGTRGLGADHNDGADTDDAQRSTTSLLGEVVMFNNRTTIIIVLLTQGAASG